MQKTEDEIKKSNYERYLSPSSINLFLECPRKFWYKYIECLGEKINIHLVKGKAIHFALERLFDLKKLPNNGYKSFLKKEAEKYFGLRFKIKSLNLNEQEEKKHRQDSDHIINTFINRIADQIEGLLINKKSTCPTHAFNMLKPKLREHDLIDVNLKVRGIIDCIITDFNNKVTLVDYKTSNKYKNALPNNYTLQLAIYAILYYQKERCLPEWLCINYLRFGESFYIKVTQDLVNWARYEITNVRNFICVNTKKEDYFKKENKFCESCDFYDECFKKPENILIKKNGEQQTLK